VDGFANRIRLDSDPILLEKSRFCIGDLDSVYVESFDTLSKLNIPFLFYEDQDKTDLEKSLDISLIFQSNEYQDHSLKNLDIEILNPKLEIEMKGERLKKSLDRIQDGKYLNEEEREQKMREIYADVKNTPPTQSIIYDYMGNRSDHVM
jgi:thiamine pyrophosphokinase